MKELEILWHAIPDKRTRRHEAVMERHAFFAACRHAGYSTVKLQEITGFDHTSMTYATKNHEANMTSKIYRKHYEYFYSFYSLKFEKKRLRNHITAMQDRLEAIEKKQKEQQTYLKTHN